MRAFDVAADSQKRHSDRDVLELLLAGTGPIAEKHPLLVERLGFNPDRPDTDPRLLHKFISQYLKYDADFKYAVREPLASGDPARVEAALIHLSVKSLDLLERDYGLVVSQGQDASAAGTIGAWRRVALTAYVAANFVVYVNAGIATNALVALVVVPAYVSYLMDPRSGAEIEKEEFIKELTLVRA